MIGNCAGTFYALGDCWSFHTAKTRNGPTAMPTDKAELMLSFCLLGVACVQAVDETVALKLVDE
jgi:glucose uptake protein GlcU